MGTGRPAGEKVPDKEERVTATAAPASPSGDPPAPVGKQCRRRALPRQGLRGRRSEVPLKVLPQIWQK